MTEHPDDLTLADYVDGLLDEVTRQRLRGHVAACAACRRDARAIGASDVPDPSISSGSASRTPVGLVAAFHRMAVPAFSVGQVWRVEWNGRAGLVVTAGPRQSDGVPAIAAAAADVLGLGDTSVIVVPAEDTDLGFEVVVHRSVRALLPGFVFDRMLTKLSDISEVTERSAVDLHPLDPVARERAARQAQLEWFADARWLSKASEVADIPSLVEERGMTLRAVAEALAVKIERALQLVRGTHRPTTDEATALGKLLGVDPASFGIDTTMVDEDVVEALGDPGWRPRLRARARRLGCSEIDTYREVAVQASRPAARRAGPSDRAIDVRQVIETILAGERP